MQLLINGTLQPAPTVTAADGITITGVSIPSGGNAAFIYQADINDYAPLAAAGNVINTVRVTGAQLAAPLTATHTISTATVPNLSIVKGICPAPDCRKRPHHLYFQYSELWQYRHHR